MKPINRVKDYTPDIGMFMLNSIESKIQAMGTMNTTSTYMFSIRSTEDIRSDYALHLAKKHAHRCGLRLEKNSTYLSWISGTKTFNIGLTLSKTKN